MTGGVPAWLILVPIAAAMAATTAYLLRWAAEARGPLRASVVVFLLLMMVAMVAGAALYFSHPGTDSLVGGLWLASGLMSVSVVIVFLGFLREVGLRLSGGAEAPPPRLARPGLFVGAVVALVVADELLMGWTFQIASGGLGSGGWSWAGLPSLAASAVNSPWFLFTMSGEMLLTTFLLRDRLSRPVQVVLVAQSVIMLLSPPALSFPLWVSVAGLAASAAMIVLFVYLMEHLYRQRQLSAGFARYLVLLLGVYGLMMAGLFLWVYYGTGLVFALSVLLEMVVFFDVIVRPEALAGDPGRPWTERPAWAFALLSGIFVAELFMGAVLDLQLEPSLYVGAFGEAAVSGPPASVLAAAVSNGFWFFATITASTWFLAMMGLEMGALVVFKMRETRHLENRIRLALMLGCYGAFTLFYPSLYFGMVDPSAPASTTIPVLGWTMGIGSAPLAPAVFVAVLVTYAVTGALVVLFGRRVICATFCSAPLMYQGTTIDAMKSFNRTSRVGRKFLSSRLSVTYSVVAGLVLGSLAVTSLLSYLDAIGRAAVAIDGLDPTVFFFTFYFAVLWYVLFVTIPYAGNYNCVTMGWCYTGVISQAFHKIGFSKLKVVDRRVCRSCTTLDCAKGCPIGLVDMPGHFRTKGEFRSSKCCGVGECVEACPYGNLYVYDVRHWIRERLGRPARPAGTRLPMVRPTLAARSSPRSPSPTATAADRPV
jgi:polyferredoxin